MVAAALDVDRAQVHDAGEALGRVGPSRHSGLPETGTWNSVLRSWLSIIESLLYCDSKRAPSRGPRPIAGSTPALKKATFSGIDRSVSAPSMTTSMPCARKASSWADEYRPVATSTPNSP